MSVEKKRAETVLIIEWVLFSLAVILVTFLTVSFSKEFADVFDNSNPYRDKTFDIIVIIILVSVLISLLLNLLLTAGIKKNNSTACRTWYIINIILIGFYILDLALALISLNFLGLIVKSSVICYRIYAVKTIMAFTRVLDDPTLGNAGGGVVYSVAPVAPVDVHDAPPPYPNARLEKV